MFAGFLGDELKETNSSDVVLADFDGDGDLDALETLFFSSSALYFVNDGAGRFEDSGQRIGTDFTTDAAAGDLDGDGDLDAYLANGGIEESDRVLFNDGSGTFTEGPPLALQLRSNAVALGDLDGDGDLDAFVATLRQFPTSPNMDFADRIYLNDGAGTFTDSGQTLASAQSTDVALGDLDGDGDLDAVVARGDPDGSSRDAVFLNDGSGQMIQSAQVFEDVYSSAVALGDLDGDGDLDLVSGGVDFGRRVLE